MHNTPSERVRRINRPPIAGIAKTALDIERTGVPVIRLSQAVPWFSPPEWALNRVSQRLSEPIMHGYSPDPGLISVRRFVVERWFAPRNLVIDPDAEFHLTCGASQAFTGALAISADPGDRVILSDPYYFDHLYAVQLLDLVPRLVPMIETDAGFRYDMDRTMANIREGARVLVLVNPSNPTGSVTANHELQVLARACSSHGCTLIIDETYERFRHDAPGQVWHPWQEEETAEWTLTVGSFSKSLGMAGWRLGYLFGARHLMEQAIKVQDAVTICAPLPAQLLLQEIVLGPFEPWMNLNMKELSHRRSLVIRTLGKGRSVLSARGTGGAFFSFLAYPGDSDSYSVTRSILQRFGIALVPGSAFGQHGEGHLRLSYGSSTREELESALERLAGLTVNDLA